MYKQRIATAGKGKTPVAGPPRGLRGSPGQEARHHSPGMSTLDSGLGLATVCSSFPEAPDRYTHGPESW